MKIIKIERMQKTNNDMYTLITFKTWWGKKFSEICISPNTWYESSYYAKSGINIPVQLWQVVRAFLETNDTYHTYGINTNKVKKTNIEINKNVSKGYSSNIKIYDELEDLKRYTPEQLKKIIEDACPKTSKIKGVDIITGTCEEK